MTRQAKKMASSYFVLLFLVMKILPSFYCKPLHKFPWADPCQTLATIDEEHPKPFLSEYPADNFGPGIGRSNHEYGKAIPEATTGSPTLTPDDWKFFHDISGKVLGSYKSPELRELAYAVSKLGPQLDLHPTSLNTAEKVWSIGVFSYLRSQIPKYANRAIPAIWRVEDLSRPRAEFLLFLLKDQDLSKFAQELWSKFPSEIEQSHHEEIKKTSSRPSKSFKRIYLAFINLKTPIDSEEAMSLMALIKDHLDYPMRPRKENGFHEEANTQILEILSHENLSVSQLGRFFRALNSLFKRIPGTYERFELLMSSYPEVTPKISKMLLKYRHGRMDSDWFSKRNLEYLIFSTQQYIRDLREVLVSKNVLPSWQIGSGFEYSHKPLDEQIVTSMLYWALKTMSKGKSVSGQEHTDTDYLLVEYILHLIALKHDDKKLYRHLLADMHVPDKSVVESHSPLQRHK
ncbi:hypothetical protein DFH28DRAFT_1215910 [Melampsora americana]|nr:hypothetical protein DFH28DRAFT_1215910 [Melampsora americana]